MKNNSEIKSVVNKEYKVTETKLNSKDKWKIFSKISSSTYVALFLVFTYIPIFTMIVLSFSSGKSVGNFSEGSMKWYTELFNDSSFMTSILVSIIVSFTATFFAVILGTLAAVGLHKNSNKWLSRTLGSISNYPIFAAEIVMGVSLMIMFITFGIQFGMGTLIFAHIMFTTPYVIVSVMPRLKQIDPNMIDASFDLGAKPTKTLFKVIIPNIKGAIFIGAAIAFAMSFDDFIISYLTSGNVENVSTHIYSIKRITPIVYAFGSLLVVVISTIFISKFFYDFKQDKKINWKEVKLESDHKQLVKKEYKYALNNSSEDLTFTQKRILYNTIFNDFDLKVKSIEISEKEIKESSNG